MSEQRLVKCVRFKQDLPGLDYPPIPNELGKKIYDNVSKDAWYEFIEYFKMVINEYRLDLTNPQTDQIMEQKIEEYFFNEDESVQMPEGYVPPEKN